MLLREDGAENGRASDLVNFADLVAHSKRCDMDPKFL